MSERVEIEKFYGQVQCKIITAGGGRIGYEISFRVGGSGIKKCENLK